MFFFRFKSFLVFRGAGTQVPINWFLIKKWVFSKFNQIVILIGVLGKVVMIGQGRYFKVGQHLLQLF